MGAARNEKFLREATWVAADSYIKIVSIVEAEDLDREFEDNARATWSSSHDRSMRR